jgi:hypothetical protein
MVAQNDRFDRSMMLLTKPQASPGSQPMCALQLAHRSSALWILRDEPMTARWEPHLQVRSWRTDSPRNEVEGEVAPSNMVSCALIAQVSNHDHDVVLLLVGLHRMLADAPALAERSRSLFGFQKANLRR